MVSYLAAAYHTEAVSNEDFIKKLRAAAAALDVALNDDDPGVIAVRSTDRAAGSPLSAPNSPVLNPLHNSIQLVHPIAGLGIFRTVLDDAGKHWELDPALRVVAQWSLQQIIDRIRAAAMGADIHRGGTIPLMVPIWKLDALGLVNVPPPIPIGPYIANPLPRYGHSTLVLRLAFLRFQRTYNQLCLWYDVARRINEKRGAGWAFGTGLSNLAAGEVAMHILKSKGTEEEESLLTGGSTPFVRTRRLAFIHDGASTVAAGIQTLPPFPFPAPVTIPNPTKPSTLVVPAIPVAALSATANEPTERRLTVRTLFTNSDTPHAKVLVYVPSASPTKPVDKSDPANDDKPEIAHPDSPIAIDTDDISPPDSDSSLNSEASECHSCPNCRPAPSFTASVKFDPSADQKYERVTVAGFASARLASDSDDGSSEEDVQMSAPTVANLVEAMVYHFLGHWKREQLTSSEVRKIVDEQVEETARLASGKLMDKVEVEFGARHNSLKERVAQLKVDLALLEQRIDHNRGPSFTRRGRASSVKNIGSYRSQEEGSEMD